MASRIPYSAAAGFAGPDDDQINSPDFQGFGPVRAVVQPIFNAQPNPPQPLVVTGASGSTGDPTSDGNRRAVGRVPGTSIVFGN